MLNILVTGAGGGVGQGIIKSLKMIEDISINIITADMSELAAGHFFGHKAKIVPAFNSDDYTSVLIDIFHQENINFYFPGTDVELKFCSKNKKYFKEKYSVHTVISSQETIEISDNKYKTAEFLKKNNFHFPETEYAHKAQDKDLKFPLILKPARGYGSIGVFRINDRDELQKHNLEDENLIIQELIGTDDDEYTCTVVKMNGKLSLVLPLQRTLRSGDTYQANPIKSNTIESYIKSIANKLDIDGGCNFQLRLNKDGIPKVFEINSRFSGTTPFCAQLGFNPVEYYLKNFLNISYAPVVNYDAQVLRFWNEIVVKKENTAELKLEKELNKSTVTHLNLFKE